MRGEARFHDTMFYLFTIGILLVSALFYLCQSFRIMNLKWEISGLKSQYQSLARSGDGLRVKLAGLNDLPELEKRAARQGFIRPKPGEMLILREEDLNDGAKRVVSNER